MSESTPNPSTSDISAPGGTESTPSASVATEAAGPNQAQTATGKRKRKRKRKRKSPNAEDGATPGTTHAGSGSPPPPPVTRSSVSSAHASSGHNSNAHGPRHDGPKPGGQGHSKKKPPFDARRASFRDPGERSGRHEFLSTWRWQPNATFLALLAPSPAGADEGAGVLTPQLQSPHEAAGELATASATEPIAALSDLSTQDDQAATAQASTDEQPEAQQPVAADEVSADAAPDTPDPSGETTAAGASQHDKGPDHNEHRDNAGQKTRKAGLLIPTGDAFAPWLASVIKHSAEPVQTSLLVSLCSHRAFRQQCANSGPELRLAVERAAAVYDALFLDSPPTVAPTGGKPKAPHHDGRDTLREGLTAVCEGAMDLVRVWPQAARERLFELASDFELQKSLYINGAQIFHDSPKQLGRLNLARICDTLATGEDALAKTQIAELKSKAGAPGLLPLLSEALDGQRFGNLVVLSYGGASSRGADPRAPKRHSGFCLESQRDVWIRSGETHESPAFEHYSQLHRRALIPSVVGLYTFGVTRSRKPYLSVLRKGISLQRRIEHSWGLSREWAVRFATDLTLLASALCRAGIRLPDLDARRFEVDDAQRLWLSDIWGGELIDPRAQDPEAVSVCRESVVGLLSSQPGFALPSDWREVICHSADFETLVATLRTLEKSRHWSA